MTPLFCLLGLAGAMVVIFASSAMETAIYRVSRVRFRLRADGGDARAWAILSLLDDIDSVVTVILVDNNLASYAAAYLLTAQLTNWEVPYAGFLAAFSITPFFFVLTESLPKQLAYGHADWLALELARVFRCLKVILFPAVRTLNFLAAVLHRLLGAPGSASLSPSRRALLLEHFQAEVAEKVLTPEQNRMAERILRLEGMAIGDCVIPLRKLSLVSASATRGQALAALPGRRDGLPALLVGPGGRPTGEALTLEALLFRAGAPGDPAASAAERLDRLIAGQSISEALRLFRSRRVKHALVAEAGRTVGLLTVRGVLERVAGGRRETGAGAARA
ncbi:MAG: CNNM domain-containing protein [Planctomycetota bacterium]|jgi:CBS domain containing-hemolysin-like protein|nr:CNNM domain-containing protein [Planctomycetota bacterium]